MLVVMQSHATEEQIRAVCERIERLGLKAHPMPGSLRTAIGITGNKGAIDLGVLESLPGVAYKPRTSPYSFQGLGEAGLKILSKVRATHGFGIITEAIDNESLDLVEEYADVIQIGARNMQN